MFVCPLCVLQIMMKLWRLDVCTCKSLCLLKFQVNEKTQREQLQNNKNEGEVSYSSVASSKLVLRMRNRGRNANLEWK